MQSRPAAGYTSHHSRSSSSNSSTTTPTHGRSSSTSLSLSAARPLSLRHVLHGPTRSSSSPSLNTSTYNLGSPVGASPYGTTDSSSSSSPSIASPTTIVSSLLPIRRIRTPRMLTRPHYLIAFGALILVGFLWLTPMKDGDLDLASLPNSLQQKLSVSDSIKNSNLYQHFTGSSASAAAAAELAARHPGCTRLPPALQPHNAANFNELQVAFLDSWKERCKLDNDKFTIVMTSSNKRIEVVKKNLARFSAGKIPSLARVYLKWYGPLPEVELFDAKKTVIPIDFVHNYNSSLNARFDPVPDLGTAFIFSHDDDMEFQPDDFEWAFQMAKKHTPVFTSFVARRWDFDEKKDVPIYRVGKDGEPYGMGTSASFYHASFADIYKHDFLQPARDLVEETRNCEDILMGFIVPYVIEEPPLLVKPLRNLLHWYFHKDMVSGGPGHWGKRDLCSTAFYKLFGKMPLEREYALIRGLSQGKVELRHIWD